MAKKRNYVNNKDLLAALIDYRDKCAEADNSGDPMPQVPEYIGKCIMMIAQRLATRPNFSGYMYKEEMISDGIENCLQYIRNFNPDKSQNPFAYFTQIIWYAFLRRISKEKKQMYIKFKASQRQMHENEVFDSMGQEVTGNLLPDYISDFIGDFEAKLNKNKVDKTKETKTKES